MCAYTSTLDRIHRHACQSYIENKQTRCGLIQLVIMKWWIQDLERKGRGGEGVGRGWGGGGEGGQ